MSFFKIKGKNNIDTIKTENKKSRNKTNKTVQELLDIQGIEENVINTSDRCKYYIRLSPKNINILTDDFLLNEIQCLKAVCNIPEDIEFLVVDKVERLEDNKNFIRGLLENSNDDIVSELLEKDLEYFKKLETSKASSREFYMVIPFKPKNYEKSKQLIENVKQALDNKGFSIMTCNKNTIKNMLQVYLERNFSGNVVKDFDV